MNPLFVDFQKHANAANGRREISNFSVIDREDDDHCRAESEWSGMATEF
jgi:hypothetical protein